MRSAVVIDNEASTLHREHVSSGPSVELHFAQPEEDFTAVAIVSRVLCGECVLCFCGLCGVLCVVVALGKLGFARDRVFFNFLVLSCVCFCVVVVLVCCSCCCYYFSLSFFLFFSVDSITTSVCLI